MIPGIVAGGVSDGGFTPIGNASTLSPAWKHSGLTLSNGNLTIAHPAAQAAQGYGSIDAKATGKWYCEVTVDAVTVGVTEAFFLGVGGWTTLPTTQMWSNGSNVGMDADGLIWVTNAGSSASNAGPGALAATDVISIAYDADDREVMFRKNGGAWYGPFVVPGSNPAFPMGTLFRTGDQVTWNFGASPFAYTVPPGYDAWEENAAYSGQVWRIQKTATQGGAGTSIAELELRLTAGGADQTGGATASASAVFGTDTANKAIDNNAATIWGAGGATNWWQCDLGSAMAIQQLSMTSRSDSIQHHAAAVVGYSNDGGTTFYPACAWNGLTWTNGETKLFDFLT